MIALKIPDKYAEQLAKRIVTTILRKGLAGSTWRDQFPEAFDDLLYYEKDMIANATDLLKRSKLPDTTLRVD